MVEVIDEPIDVSAIFRNGRIKPLSFIWNRERYEIKEVTYTWNDRQGEARLFYFSVSDGANLYELCFNSKTMDWKLNRVYIEG